MTPAEITAYVMGLPVEDVRRLSATEIMGWVYTPERRAPNGEITTFGGWRLSDDASYRGRTFTDRDWRPDEDRNQSRMVTNMIGTKSMIRLYRVFNETFEWESHWDISPLDETRAALIAHMIYKEESSDDTGTSGGD